METIDPYATSTCIRNESNLYTEIQNDAFKNEDEYSTVEDTNQNNDVPKSLADLYSVVNKKPRWPKSNK